MPSRSGNTRVFFFFFLMQQATNVVVSVAGKANTKLVPLAVLSTSRHRCRCVDWLNVTASPPLPRAFAPFLWMNFACVFVYECEWRRYSYSACANTLTKAHMHTHTYKCILSDVWVFSWMEFEFGVLFSGAAAYHTHAHKATCHFTNTHANDVLWMIIKSSWIEIYDADNLDFAIWLHIQIPITKQSFFFISIKVSANIKKNKKGQHRHWFHEWGRVAFLYLTVSLSFTHTLYLPISSCLVITVTTSAFATRGDRFSCFCCGYFVYLTGFTFPVSPFLSLFWCLRRVSRELWKQQKNSKIKPQPKRGTQTTTTTL